MCFVVGSRPGTPEKLITTNDIKISPKHDFNKKVFWKPLVQQAAHVPCKSMGYQLNRVPQTKSTLGFADFEFSMGNPLPLDISGLFFGGFFLGFLNQFQECCGSFGSSLRT
jgi:hypothetical protein